MNIMDEYEKAMRHVFLMIKGQDVTPDLIRQKAGLVIQMFKAEENSFDIDIDFLCREVESRCNLWIGDATILEDKKDHEIWLPHKKAQIEWKLWKRYRRYLEEEFGLTESIVNKLDDLTDNILERFEDPTRNGSWDRRGMVAGHVQSGKTANYIALMCKAADAGYKLIVVLAGMHKNLRSQTQLRIDEGLLGYDSRLSESIPMEKMRIGVRSLPGAEAIIPVYSLTSSDDDGDFKRNFADRSGYLPGGADPIVLVVKKHTSVLKNLIRWATSVVGEKDPLTKKIKVRKVPLLLIDDEADNASINTKAIPIDIGTGEQPDDYDVTAINGQIRLLLNTFEKSAYVGYTATPFANIFIYPYGKTDRYGEDLFPRSFVVNLPIPSNYISPVKVFGLQEGEGAGFTESKGLPIIRYISDYDDYFPDKHKKDHVPIAIPPSLKLAIRYFIISCAARLARGMETKHNSMLIHITRFTLVQGHIYELVSEELGKLRRRLEYGDGKGANSMVDDLNEIWIKDYLPTSETIINAKEIDDPMMTRLSWSDVKARLYDAASRIQLKLINGRAKDILDYREYEQGMFAIAIGGEKLSRGLTLEGLTVSYYLRATKMYDTLMQMGRWFGYRPGYLDLCRIFTSPELAEWYKYITLANEELRGEFDYMASIGKTPENYGLRVRTDADGLLITAANKMRDGVAMDLSYSGKSSETTIFHTDENIVSSNFSVTEEFIRTLGNPELNKKTARLWKDVSPQEIIELLAQYQIHQDSRKANASLLIDYIRAQANQDELISWTVGLISTTTGRSYDFAGYKVGLSVRKATENRDTSRYCLNKGRLLSRRDEALDLNEDEWPVDSANKKITDPSPHEIRAARPKERGLLLIYLLEPPQGFGNSVYPGLFFSFPNSVSAKSIKYKVNNTYWEQEFGDML